MGKDNRSKSYNIRMNEEELSATRELAQKVKLPELIREYIKTLSEENK